MRVRASAAAARSPAVVAPANKASMARSFSSSRDSSNVEDIAVQCAEWAAEGITTSTYGLGNHFNEDLMVAIARAGAGNHYYGDTAEDLMEPFQQELELLGNLCLRDLRIKASAPDGVQVSMVNDLPAVGDGWRLPDLAWGAEAWAVLRVSVPVVALPAVGSLWSALQVTVALFGANLDAALVDADVDGSGAQCQEELLKGANRIVDDMWRVARGAVKDGLAGHDRQAGAAPDRAAHSSDNLQGEILTQSLDDEKGKIQGEIDRLLVKAQSRCVTAATPLPQLFPGDCAGASGNAASEASATAPVNRVCLMVIDALPCVQSGGEPPP